MRCGNLLSAVMLGAILAFTASYATADVVTVFTDGVDLGVHSGSPDTVRTDALGFVGGALGVDAHRTWFKFDLSALPAGATINSATLNVTVTHGAPLPLDVGVALGGDSWSQTTLTWNNQPPISAPGDIVSTGSLTFSATFSWDATSFVAGEFAGDGVASLVLLQIPESASSLNITVDRDVSAPNPGFRPSLVVDFGVCGNGTVDPGEQCDGTDDAACPGACLSDCTCGAFCGNSACEPGEDSCNCPNDCGTPPSNEVLGATCADGNDNDCDGLTDAADPDCAGAIPTVSTWGLIVMALLLPAGAKVYFNRHRPARA